MKTGESFAMLDWFQSISHYQSRMPAGESVRFTFGGAGVMNENDIKLDHDLMGAVALEYRVFVEENPEAEAFKYEILQRLNEQLDIDDLHAENISDFAHLLQSENPKSGSFVHWMETSGFVEYVDENPEEAAELIRNLFVPTDRTLSERISALRSSAKSHVQNFSCGTPFVGYLMSAYDRWNYAIYKDSSFKTFAKMFDLSIPSDIGDKYEFYLAIGTAIREFFQDQYGEDTSMLQAQNVMYVSTEYPGQEFKIYLRYLYGFSQQLHCFKNNTGQFISAIEDLPEHYLHQERRKYEDEEKVGRIRYRILNSIIDEGFISETDVEQIAGEVSDIYEKDILHSWTHFSILFQIYYDHFKERIRRFLQTMHREIGEYLRTNGLPVKLDNTISDYSWNQNFGSTRCWLAFFPEDKASHKQAVQFFLAVAGEGIEYGLVSGSEFAGDRIRKVEMEADLDRISFDRIIRHYAELSDEYEHANSLEPVGPEDGHISSCPPSSLSIDFYKGISFDGLHFPNMERLRKQVETAIRNGRHLMLIGPPGTGKSRLATAICKSYGAEHKMVTATSDWSTYETIGGYRPDRDMKLQFSPGVFLDCFKDIATGEMRNQWLIVDELNRADMDKAFGSLFSVLAGDSVTLSYRAPSEKNVVVRPQRPQEALQNGADGSDHEFIIPRDWRMLATMNTYDKMSLYEMSYALMRRFAFVAVSVPERIDTALIEQYLDCWDIQDSTYAEEAGEIWRVINKYRQIGPAILRDVYEHLLGASGDAAGAISMYVFPQLEGLRDIEVHNLLRDIKDISILEDARILQKTARDYFGLDATQ